MGIESYSGPDRAAVDAGVNVLVKWFGEKGDGARVFYERIVSEIMGQRQSIELSREAIRAGVRMFSEHYPDSFSGDELDEAMVVGVVMAVLRVATPTIHVRTDSRQRRDFLYLQQ